jgi:membrane-bound metal-dependent hydrolase YbcI (DUF457 family)
LSRLHPVLLGGAVVGVLDIGAAFVLHGARGVHPRLILQAVAGGLLGPAAFRGSWRTAAIGLLLHFFIATMVVLVYWGVSRVWPLLRQRPLVMGPLYGIAVYVVMTYGVLPLSRAGGGRPGARWLMAANILIHMVCVGLPTALIVARRPRS